MNAAQAQTIASQRTLDLLALGEKFRELLQRIHDADRDLRAVLPLLTPAAAAEVNAALEKASTQLADTFAHLLNPAGEPA